jgi:hypothetical protein
MILLLGTIIGQTYKANNKIHLRTIHQNKERLKKNALKDRARCYGYESARNTENGERVEKKQLSEDLHYKRKQKNYELHLF